MPLTTQSGESLAGRLPESPEIAAHVAAGDRVQWVAALFGLCLFAVVALDLRRRASMTAQLAPAEAWVSRRAPAGWRDAAPSWTSSALAVARVLLVVAAIAVIVVVVQAGHSGASAVWSGYPNLQP